MLCSIFARRRIACKRAASMKSGLNICIRECRMAEGVRTRSDAELATSNGYRLSSIGGSRPSPDVHRNCSSVCNRHVCVRNLVAHQPAVSSHQRPSATDCFLVPERGHAPARATDSRRPGLIVRREHRTYFGTVKRMRGEPCWALVRNVSRAASIAGRFSRAHSASAFNGTIKLRPSSVNS